MNKNQLYLSKDIRTKYVTIHLILKTTKDKKQAIAIVTNPDYTEQMKDEIKPIDYKLFGTAKESFKDYIKKILIKYKQEVNIDSIDSLISDLEAKIESNIEAEETLENIANDNFNKCYNFSLDLLTPKDTITKPDEKRLNIIDLSESIITKHYKEELYDIVESINKNDDYKSLVLDYKVLSMYSDLADILEDNPETLINSFNKAIANLRMDKKDAIILTRFKNIDNRLKLRDAKKSKRIGQLIEVEATVKITEDVRPEIETAVFRCNGCDRLHVIEQKGENLIAPTLCSDCGGRIFSLQESESKYKDTQSLIIQEPLEETKGQPKTLKLKLTTDLVDTIRAGNTAKVTGILKATKKTKKDNKQDFILEANNVKSLDKDLDDIIITPEEEKAIIEISKKEDLIEFLANSIAPNVRGYSEIKKGLLCSIAGAGETYNKRNMIHVLIIGDPGIAKTQLIRGLEDITVKSITTDGAGASGKGLTAVTSQDSNGNWTIEAGALPLANNGYVFIDEIDKLAKDKQSELDSALESGIIYINRAGISSTLQANTTVLAFGNPKYRRFSKYKTIAEQLDINEDIKSRMDLIYAIEDKPNIEDDTKISNAIFNSYINPDNKEDNTIISSDLLKKYIVYAKRNYKPILSSECNEVLTKHYVSSRNKDYSEEDEIIGYEPRDLDSLIRIGGALAKLKFKQEIGIIEIKEAIDIQNYYLNSIGIDPITNKVDIAKAKGIPVTADKRARDILLELIKKNIKEYSNLGIDYINKSELKELFINETSYSYETFKKRYRELVVNEDIKVKGKQVYLND